MKNKHLKVYVAIGCSAGGFEALSEFVSLMPKKTGMYYFVAQHHALEEESMLAHLLQRSSKMKVSSVENGMLFKPDILYILPPKLQIKILNNTPCAVDANLTLRHPLPNVDILFDELSQIKKSKLIAIVLSGSGSDGSRGVRVVKEFDGVTISQNPAEAVFENMPYNAIETQTIDYILNIEDIVSKMLTLADLFFKGTYKFQELPFITIIKTLHKEKNLNLFQYKEETINRRIQKRMDTLGISKIEEYADFFKNTPEEIEKLNEEVLIGVTQFFRDKKAFASLRNHLKNQLIKKAEHTEFRVWSVACSTGEEPYSLAILIDDILEEIGKNIYVKIFASDIDDVSLETARSAYYKNSSIENVKDVWRDKYFVQSEGGYNIVKKIREQVIFAHHNFLNNPAFINIDLISCRNILIYLKSSVQENLFSIFNYSLNNNGLLFLGSSESILSSYELFCTLDLKYRVYQKDKDKGRAHLSMNVSSKNPNKLVKKIEGSPMQQFIHPKEIEKYFQEEMFTYVSSGSLIVDADNTIIFKKGTISYLSFHDGLVSLDLYDSLDKALHYETKKLLKKVKLSGMKELSKFVKIKISQSDKLVQVVVQPFKIPEKKLMYLMNFTELNVDDLIAQNIILPSFTQDDAMKRVSDELGETRTEMEELSEELLFSKQTMALVNEELQNSNEKLQSTVEELETSNEELQSSNEELQVSLTSNRELQNKFALILESTMDGIIGLDMKTRHTFVNKRAAEMLGYSPEYLIGKDSHKLWHHTKADGSYFPEEECPILEVLNTGKSTRGEDVFWKKDGSSFPVEFLRAPLLEDGKIIGAVINFHDLSEKKALEEKILQEHENVLKYMDASGLIFLLLSPKGAILDINSAGLKLLQITKEEVVGMNWFENFLVADEKPLCEVLFDSIIDEKPLTISHNINKVIDTQKNEYLISWNNTNYTDDKGNLLGVLATGNNITNETFLEKEFQKLNVKYEQTFKAAQVGITHIGLDGAWLDVNNYFSKLIGYTKDELLSLNFQKITHPDDLDLDLEYMKKLLNGELSTYHKEKRVIRKNGNIVWINLSVILIRDDENKPQYFIAIIQDISQVKLLMFELEAKKSEFESIIRFAPNPIMIYDEDGKILLMNEVFSELTGYTIHDIYSIGKWSEKIESTQDITDEFMIHELFVENKSVDAKQIKITTKSGKQLIWAPSLGPLGNIYEGKKMIIYMASDITQMLENEEMLLAQSRQAAMGDMIGMIAHQWRQPLSVLSMASNNLRIDLELNTEIKEDELYSLTELFNDQIKYLSQTIDDFRTFLKPQKEKEKILLCSVYDSLLNLIGKSFENNQINLNFINDCEIEITTYQNELVQVFINILNNAKDAIKGLNVKDAYINITTKLKDNNLIIEIEDNGGGIDEKILHKLGEPYISSKNKNGTGLGVYMSKMILEKHFDGTLSWKNCNKGSCFTIELALE